MVKIQGPSLLVIFFVVPTGFHPDTANPLMATLSWSMTNAKIPLLLDASLVKIIPEKSAGSPATPPMMTVSLPAASVRPFINSSPDILKSADEMIKPGFLKSCTPTSPTWRAASYTEQALS